MTPNEKNARLDGPIHGWFGLTYANYQVLHRTLMQSMPVDWQERMVACLEEMREAFEHIEHPANFIIEAAEEREYGDINLGERRSIGATYDIDNDRVYDRDGNERESWERVLIRLPDGDPIPHYNRGRTFIEPSANAGAVS